MSDNTNLSNVISQIQALGFDYMYIDDDGIEGTLDPNVFRTVKRYYYLNNDGNEVYLSEDKKIAEDIVKQLDLNDELDDDEIYQEENFSKQIYSFDDVFYEGMRKTNIYLIDKKVESPLVICRILGTFNTFGTNRLTGEAFDVEIEHVEVNENYRNKKLCKLMTQLYLLIVNKRHKRNLSFALYNINEAKDISCKCYFDAFNECGYVANYYQLNIAFKILAKGTNMTKNLCDEKKNDMLLMTFRYRDIGTFGGKKNKKSKKYVNKNRNRTRKNKKTISNSRRLKCKKV